MVEKLESIDIDERKLNLNNKTSDCGSITDDVGQVKLIEKQVKKPKILSFSEFQLFKVLF